MSDFFTGMVYFALELAGEFILESLGRIISGLIRGVSNLFYRTPKRWNRLQDKHKQRLIAMREKRRRKLEKKYPPKERPDGLK